MAQPGTEVKGHFWPFNHRQTNGGHETTREWSGPSERRFALDRSSTDVPDGVAERQFKTAVSLGLADSVYRLASAGDGAAPPRRPPFGVPQKM